MGLVKFLSAGEKKRGSLNGYLALGTDGKQLIWRKGAVFTERDCRALVQEEENRDGLKIINIAINGKAGERKFLLRHIRSEIKALHEKWFRNIQAEQMIPCTCEYCVDHACKDANFFKHSTLLRAYERKKPTVQCDKEFIDVPVTGLLEGVLPDSEFHERLQNGDFLSLCKAEPPTGEQVDIFLSYSSKNRIYAAQLAQCLENSGYSVWWDTNLIAGDHFRSEIQAKLVAAKCTVVLWSEHAVKSEWVQEEAGYAHSEKKLVPTKLDTTELPMPFGGLQTISLESWHGDQNDPCLTPLLHAIKKKMEK